MVEVGALVLAGINLVLALLDERKRTAPKRAAAAQREGLEDDLAQMDRALAEGDASGIAAAFEVERRAGLRRMAPGWPPERLRGDAGGDPKQP